MPRTLALAALVLTLAAAGCGGKDSGAKTGSTASTAASTTATTTTVQEKDSAGCVVTAAPKPRGPGKESKPTLTLSPSKAYAVTLKTNCGSIVIALDVKRAPKTSASFASLVKNGFYDGLTFHRVLADFVIQGGDPLGNGQGGPGYNIVEKPPGNLRYKRGVVAMAKAGVDPPGASGSQFFIVTAEDAGLPPDYALVGKVKTGFDAINRIIAQPVDGPNGVPLSPVVIETATIDPAP
ncbi:MAG: peptidyl-prolyl cis-trans isomerase cyclophilin type [Solirubrobacterales bacterium]|nr:peptidyl-prolyl cis-trans isomerase cyclophilin type [Solirubrobacterales bacterium]